MQRRSTKTVARVRIEYYLIGQNFSSVVDWSTAQVNKAVRVDLNSTPMSAVVLQYGREGLRRPMGPD